MNRTPRFIILNLFLFIFFTFTSPVFAQNTNDVHLSISPSILEIKATTPATIEAPIKIRNMSDIKINLNLIYRTIKGNYNATGVIELKNEKSLEEPDVLIRSKIKVYKDQQAISRIEINPNEEISLLMRINLDENIPDGDYYFSILFISNNTKSVNEKSGSITNAGIGSNIILSVGEKGPTKGYISSFSAPNILSSGPIPFTLQIENSSDHYIKPQGRISIRDMFGNNVGKIDIVPGYILAHSSRYLNDSENQDSKFANHPILLWNEKALFGIYSADAIVKLSDSGPLFNSSITFVVIPIHLLIGLSLLSFFFAGIYIKTRNKIKKSEQNTKAK